MRRPGRLVTHNMDRRLKGWSGRRGARGCAVLLVCVGLALTLAFAALFASPAPSFARVRNYPTGPEPDAVALGSISARGREGTLRSTDDASALAAERDGTLVAAGSSRKGSGRRFALARYTPDGTLDRRFGTGGKVLTGFGGAQSFARATSLAIRRDGKIVVAGWTVPLRLNNPFALARYTVSGKLDRTFGRKGRVLTYFGSRVECFASAVAISADGKVVAVGYCISFSGRVGLFALARYTARGRLDASFGRGGRVLTDFGARCCAEAARVAIQADGKIVVAGDASRRTATDFALARYNANGSLDRSFGKGGRVVTKVGEGDSYAAAIVVQSDGKLVVAGRAYVKPDGVFALARYSADGKLDPSFGRGGIVVPNGNASAYALAIQRDRKLVTALGPFGLARFLEDGSLDESFGRDGRVRTDFHAGATANGVVVRTDGKIVAAGGVGTYPRMDFALARYTSSGRLDGTFGSGGKVVTDFGSVWAIRGR
jgi:uncharacterized delta-60 repeat protein